MIHNLKAYSAYKDSGVPWLGKVPEHWELHRLKAAVSQINNQTSEKKPEEIYLALEHVESWTGRVRLPDDNITFDSQVKKFRSNDVLFGKLRPYLAKVARLSVDGVCVGEFLVLRPYTSTIISPFLENVLRSKSIIDVINSSTFGAKMPRADWGFIGSLLLCFPPASEQYVIVHYLDYIDQRIRRYIHEKQKLIKLLEEQKQAIIYQAVTRGLDPNVRFKPSGVEWLGEVPEHWEKRRIKSLFREKDERSGDGNGVLLSLTRARGIIPQAEASNRIASAEDLSKYKVCLPDDLIMNRMQAWSGMFAVSSYKGLVSPDYSVFTTIGPLEVKYFEYLFKIPALVDQFAQRSKGIGSGFNRLYTPDFGAISVVIPPISEQSAIVRFLDNVNCDLSQAIEKAHREISLLREYRTRLIADVVTGKLDVREAAVNLPEKSDVVEVEDDFEEETIEESIEEVVTEEIVEGEA